MKTADRSIAWIDWPLGKIHAGEVDISLEKRRSQPGDYLRAYVVNLIDILISFEKNGGS